MNEKLKCDSLDQLFAAFLKLETVDECYRFFSDLATTSELKSLAQRLEVAKMLRTNETYSVISSSTGASTATISRVKNCLLYGADGYVMILDRLKEENQD